MNNKLVVLILIVLGMTISAANASQIDEGDILQADLNNGAFINIPGLFIFTDFNVSTGQFQVTLNDSSMIFQTNTNKTLTNIQINSNAGTFSFTANGTDGYLNSTFSGYTPAQNYRIKKDGISYQIVIANASGYLSFNNSEWSEHTFTGEELSELLSTSLTWWNSISGNSLVVHAEGSESIEFGISNNDITITTSVWTLDGTVDSETSKNFTTSLNSLGVHTLSVYGNIPTGATDTVTWKLLSVREKSGIGDEVALLNDTWFDSLTDSMNGSSPDFTQFISAIVLPYTTQMGALFYVFIYLLPLATIWLRQEKVLIPAGLLGIFGLVLIPLLPAEWRLLAGLCVILTSFGVVYSLFKERG